METGIYTLILKFKEIKKLRVKTTKVEVTPLEVAKYKHLRLKVLRNVIHRSHTSPDEAIVNISALNTDNDRLVFTTTIRGRQSIPLKNLGYHLRGNVWVLKR